MYRVVKKTASFNVSQIERESEGVCACVCVCACVRVWVCERVCKCAYRPERFICFYKLADYCTMMVNYL